MGTAIIIISLIGCFVIGYGLGYEKGLREKTGIPKIKNPPRPPINYHTGTSAEEIREIYGPKKTK